MKKTPRTTTGLYSLPLKAKVLYPMKFSILVANFNNGKYFETCYNSIISQSYTNWEVVIVDDKSTDNSVAVISSLIHGDSRFSLHINEENKGCGYTKKRCAELAVGELSGFVDPDDAISPDALMLMVIEHQNRPEVSLVHSSFFFCDDNLSVTNPFDLAKHVAVDNTFINMDGAVTAFSSFKMDAYNKTHGIHSCLLRAVDQDLYLQLSEVGSFYFIDKPLYFYRIHNNGIASNNSIKAFYCHLKVVIWAEERRGINLESFVEPYLSGKNKTYLFYARALESPKFLIGRLLKISRRKIKGAIKNLIG